MIQERPCRLCEEALGMTREDIRALVERTRLSAAQELAPDALYDARLDACERCDGLLGGATCLHCGCIVPVRAMGLAGTCPHPGGTRW